MKIRLFFLALLSACAISPFAGAANLDVSAGGILTGAHNVNVGGTLYDVVFRDGTFNQLFCNGGCMDAHTDQEAIQFSQALLDQVFVDGTHGAFNTNTSLIGGCGNPSFCNAWTPYVTVGFGGTSVGTDGAVNYSSLPPGYSDFVYTGAYWGSGEDMTQWSTDTFADWSLSAPAAVPIPQAAWLFGSGLLGLTGLARKRKAA